MFTGASNHIAPVVKNHVVKDDDNLELYLKQITNIFNISNIIDAPLDKAQIINYYVANKLSYRLGLNWEGFFHCGISYDGKHKSGDFKEQARIIESYIKNKGAKQVLELAYGLGPNCAFLARRNPQVRFDAVDISNKPLRRFTKMPNLNFCFGDYHDLSQFEDNSFDIVFVIEALCYSTQKLEVLREVKKKLKENGIFIVFDAYKRNRASPLSPSEKTMWALVVRGSALDTFEYVDDVESYMEKEFSIVLSKDFSLCVLPSLEGQEAKVRYYFNHATVAKAINKVVPFDVVKHLPMVLLIPTSVRRQIGCYYLHVLQKGH
jgi:ubiquinone/menaquinone biosynthesis C-methylase UbiE